MGDPSTENENAQDVKSCGIKSFIFSSLGSLFIWFCKIMIQKMAEEKRHRKFGFLRNVALLRCSLLGLK